MQVQSSDTRGRCAEANGRRLLSSFHFVARKPLVAYGEGPMPRIEGPDPGLTIGGGVCNEACGQPGFRFASCSGFHPLGERWH